MPLGMEVGLGAGDFVLDEDPSPRKRGTSPTFGPCLLWPNGWMDCKMVLGRDIKVLCVEL